jgi:hypothetical protein
MTGTRTARALAKAAAGLVGQANTGDLLALLVRSCAEAYPAAAVALMVRNSAGTLEPVSATSHRAVELELLQGQAATGPCVDAVRLDAHVESASRADMEERWGEVGRAIGQAGFGSVHAYAMHWEGEALGGLNIFRIEASPATEEEQTVGQLFADIATLTLVRAQVPAERVTARIHEAITARAVIEQAKGVLAYQLDLDMAAAYDALLAEAQRSGRPLSETAKDVVERQHRRG